jgi:hypothetical protein
LTEKDISDAEGWAVLAFCMAASVVAIVWSWRHGAMLNYGDAVAHLHIARRVLDSHRPGFTQLGSVWLPLPHILLIPFVQDYEWWATGLAAVIPSSLAFIAACAGLYRLARHWLSPAAAALTLAFFTLNPNLLYLQTTAMTEPLFLCEMIWIVVWMVEWRAALNDETEAASYNLRPISSPRQGPRRRLVALARRPLRIFEASGKRRGAWLASPAAPPRASWKENISSPSTRLEVCIAAALVAAIFTRYDGWIIAFVAWTAIGLALRKRGRLHSRVFWLASAAVVAAPILWFVYNSAAFGDWLFFARGPFSAKAIELRTAAPGWPPHPGWHNPWVSLLFFLKVSELDSTAAACGNVVLAFAALGTAYALFAEKKRAGRSVLAWALLLWIPVPFYAYSVAYGSVPIFIPPWWPHNWYNTRYGLELLPALALGLGFVAHFAVESLRRLAAPRIVQVLPRIAFALFFVLVGFNFLMQLREHPPVYVEGTKNLEARLAYDDAIPPLLQELLSTLPRAPVLMDTSAYPELVAFTGIPLRQTINESDKEFFRAALAAPAASAAVIVAFDGDAIDHAVREHPANLDVAGRFTAKDQPTATVYVSELWFNQIPNPI